MADGTYLALNGLRTRIAELDRLAADLANVGTAGYKRERTSTHGSERPTFDMLIQKATDPTMGNRKIDLSSGGVTRTGRDLDFALKGPGFFAVETPFGTRYTRNGSFERGADGTLTTSDGLPVLGEGGPIRLNATGAISVDADGTVRTGTAVAGRLQVVRAESDAAIAREGSSRFRIDDVEAVETPEVVNQALEQSNVSVVDGMAQLTALSRSFDALQRGLVSLLSEVDGKAISELGRH
jgi:flagellar basal body rod protein FlgG